MLVLLALAVMTVSFVMGVGTSTTGPVEKVALLLMICGCVYAAAKVTDWSDRLVHRLSHH